MKRQKAKGKRQKAIASISCLLLTALCLSLPIISKLDISLIRITSSHAVFAQEDPYNLKSTSEHAGLKDENTDTDLAKQIGTLIRTGLGFIGVVFFVLIFYAGVKWMTARGKEEITADAKQIIENSVIGLIVIAIAYALTTFIFERVLK